MYNVIKNIQNIMKKYIFRTIFYSTIVLSIFALGVDYDNSEFSTIITLFGIIIAGGTISYNVMQNKTIKEISEITGIPEKMIR